MNFNQRILYRGISLLEIQIGDNEFIIIKEILAEKMLKQGNKVQSTFLRRFQGKQNKIMKGGFIEMLNPKKSQILQEKAKTPRKNHQRHTSQVEKGLKQRVASQSHIFEKILPSQISKSSLNMAKPMVKTQNEQEQNILTGGISKSMIFQTKLKLPQIIRSSSRNLHLLSNNAHHTKIKKQQYSLGLPSKQLSKEYSLKDYIRSENEKFNHYARLHLQNLQRFERELIYNKLSHGKKIDLN